MQQNYAHYVKGLDPVADAFDGTKYSDIIYMGKHQYAEFIIYCGVGATGTSTITLEASSDNAGSVVTAIPFKYQEILTDDTHGHVTTATTAGFTTTAGSSKIIVVFADANDMGATGKAWLRLKAVESVNSPVLGGIMIRLTGAKWQKEQQTTVLS